MYTLQENKMMKKLIEQRETITRRQELPDVYALNGAVYVADINWLQNSGSFLEKETVAFVMTKNRSYDIDTEDDFLMCDFMLSRSLKDNSF
ncbi:CMP-N,N'-diacetyllegionaminic acid synthase [compost metagenome]